MWSDFNKELKYKYISLLLKDLSLAEQSYLQLLRDGIDDQINTSITWLNDNRNELKELHDFNDWLEYYKGSELERILLTLLDDTVNKSIQPLYNFYNTGGSLAYKHMSKPSVFQESDHKSLNILSDFNKTVVSSINTEFTVGVVDSIGKSIEDKSYDYESLFDLRSNSGKDKFNLNKTLYSKVGDLNNFSTDTRCLFAVKTEYARAVNTGLLQAYSNYGVDSYEWVTSGLPNVCKQCLSYEEESPYTLNEIINMMPVHVNCVCSVKGLFNNNYLELDDTPVIVDLTPKLK